MSHCLDYMSCLISFLSLQRCVKTDKHSNGPSVKSVFNGVLFHVHFCLRKLIFSLSVIFKY